MIDEVPSLIFVNASYTIEVRFFFVPVSVYHGLFFSVDEVFLTKYFYIVFCSCFDRGMDHVFYQTVEAERLSVDHVAHIKPSDGSSAATQRNVLLSILSFVLDCLM